jgi:hypothetical protein
VTARDLLRNGAQLAGLWALAVAQPLFEVLKNGELFVAARWRGADIALFALCVAFLPALVLVALEALAARFRPGLARALHVAFVAAIVAIFVLYAIKHETDLRTEPSLLIAAAAAGAAAFLHVRFEPFRLFTTVTSPASVLVVALFLLGAPIRHLVLPADGADLRGPKPAGPVVMIVFDELPTLALLDGRGELDARSYPAFARLARDGTWFRNATSVSDATAPGTSAILTGRRQDGETPASQSAQPENLIALLGRRGGGHVRESTHTRLCPPAVCERNAPDHWPGRMTRRLGMLTKLSLATFVPDGIYRLIRPSGGLFRNPPSERAFAELNASFDAPAALHYVHPFLPHGPWYRMPSGRRYVAPTPVRDFLPGAPNVAAATIPKLVWVRDPRRVTHVVQRHLAQVRAADRLLGQTLDRLREKGLYERATIVAVADHGVAFRPGSDARRLRRETAEQILHVPLFVKLPGGRKIPRPERFMQTVDLVPTLADALGLRLPWKTDGRSMLAPGAAQRTSVEADAYESGEHFEFSAAALAGRLRAAAAERAALFRGTDPARIFRTGPNRELMGRPIASLPRGPASPLRYVLPAEQRSFDFDPRSGAVPGIAAGLLRGPRASGRELVLALNGRVAATPVSHPSGSDVRFEALLPEHVIRPGRNRLEVYEMTTGGRLSEVRRGTP